MLTSAKRVRNWAFSVLTLMAVILTATPATAQEPLIGGFFIYSSSSASVTNAMLDEIKATGADTVITFGSRLKPAGLISGRPDAEGFGECIISGMGCVDAALAGRAVRGVFTYVEQSSWHPAGLICPLDKTFENAGKRYTVLLLPSTGSGCDAPSFDVVVSLDAPDASKDRTALMLDAAAARGMGVFMGMPAPVMQTSGSTWLPDSSYSDVLTGFTDRFLRNTSGYTSNSALRGFYHHLEMPLSTSDSWSPVLDVYRMQNASVAANRPGLATLVSPYMDARKNSKSATKLDQVGTAAQKIAATSNGVHMIVAPQDGQGTGKVGAFSADMRGEQVDAPSAAVAGAGSYQERYYGSTGDYMREVSKALAGKAEVWINIEMMTASTTGAPSCDDASNGRGKASIERIQRQVGVGKAPGVSKAIGFMWTPYAICGGGDSLAAALKGSPGPTHEESSTPPAAPKAPTPPKAPRPAALAAQPSELVKAVQEALLGLGYDLKGGADGFAGASTESTVRLFQQENGHPETGLADDATLAQIQEVAAKRAAMVETSEESTPSPGDDEEVAAVKPEVKSNSATKVEEAKTQVSAEDSDGWSPAYLLFLLMPAGALAWWSVKRRR